jgi:hypothetical protein
MAIGSFTHGLATPWPVRVVLSLAISDYQKKKEDSFCKIKLSEKEVVWFNKYAKRA